MMSKMMSQKLGQLSFDYMFHMDGQRIRRYVRFSEIQIDTEQYRFKVNSAKMPYGVNEIKICQDEVMLSLGLTIAKPVSFHLAPGTGLWLLVDREHGLGNVPTFVKWDEVVRAVKRKGSLLAIPIGFAAGRTPVVINLDKDTSANFLIGGAPGGGKSSLLHTIICTLIQQRPTDVNLLLFDFKRVEFRPFYKDVPHLVEGQIVTMPSEFGPKVEWLLDETVRRYELMESKGANHIDKYNGRVAAQNKMPRLVLIVDELAFVMLDKTIKDRNTIESNLARIAQLGRACGIHMVLCTQRPERSVVTGLIHACCPGKVAYACASVDQSKIIIGNGEAAFKEESPEGRAILAHSRFRYPFQTAWIPDSQRHKIVEAVLAEQYTDAKTGHDVTMEELARFALEHWEGKFKVYPLYNQFKDRLIGRDEIKAWAEIHLEEPFQVEGDRYILKPVGRKRAHQMVKIEEGELVGSSPDDSE